LDYEFKGTMGSVWVSLFKASPRLKSDCVYFLKKTFKRDFTTEIYKILNFCKMQECNTCYFACNQLKMNTRLSYLSYNKVQQRYLLALGCGFGEWFDGCGVSTATGAVPLAHGQRLEPNTECVVTSVTLVTEQHLVLE